MDAGAFRDIERRVLADEEGAAIAQWAERLQPCESADKFLSEAIWVILCSGISYRAARTMEKKLHDTGECSHPGKNKAIGAWLENYERWWLAFDELETGEARVTFLRTLPYMGPALSCQLAKNLGVTDYCKPDRHLIRIAGDIGPQAMCEALAAATDKTVAYIDTVVWFAAMRSWVKADG
jgi:hypothetical protein